MKLWKFIFIVSVLPLSTSVGASMILLSDNTGAGLSVYDRLVGLGHSVTISDSSTWDASFDYSIYDVVAFEYASKNPFDMSNFVDAVSTNQVGALFFRGADAESTSFALGLTSTSTNTLNWQTPTSLDIVDNSHYITSGLSTGANDLGYSYMSYVNNPGADTTVLGNGSSGASLVVHNTLRAAITPFYGHTSGYDNETQIGLDITQRSIEWAAGATVVPVPASVWLFGSGLLVLFTAAKRKARP